MVDLEEYEDYYSNDWKDLVKALEHKDVIDSDAAQVLAAMIASPDKENAVVASEILKQKIKVILLERLNVGQQEAFRAITNFFMGVENYDAVVLKGYAGTGKTYLVKRLLEYIVRAFPGKKIAITAPTNKAVHVLARNSPYSDNSAVFEDYSAPDSRIVYCTVHKLLNKKEVITDTGQQIFVAEKNNAKIKDYTFLFVDETSVLDDKLFYELMFYCKELKIVFLGDPAQIPPINREFSQPFRKDSEFNFLRLQLDEIMRQKGDNPIIEASMLLRENLRAYRPLGELETKLNDRNEGVVRIHSKTDRPKVRPLLEKLFTHSAYGEDPDFCKILAWRNKSVDMFNRIVRSILFDNTTAPYVVGERLIANAPLFEEASGRYGKYYSIKANTSDEFKVTWVSVVTRVILDPVKFERHELKFWYLRAERLAAEGMINLYIIHEDSAKEYKELCAATKKEAVTLKTSAAWINYFDLLKQSDDLAYSYAITVHKSQGSTYDYTLFIEEDVDKNRKTFERNRIKYTAYTRAKKKLFVLI